MSGERICLLVLGMHRSGTSAVTRALNLLGASLPADLVEANPTNQLGHWEPRRLMQLNNHILAHAGRRWDDWRPLDLAKIKAEELEAFRSEARQIIEEDFADLHLFALKEPRVTLLAGFYADILRSMNVDVRYIVTNRNPLAICQSLASRNRMTVSQGSLLWLRYSLAAERQTRGLARAFVSYEDIVSDWLPPFRAIESRLKIEWPNWTGTTENAVSSHFTSKHQNHVADEHRLKAHPEIPNWVKEAYSAYRLLEVDDGSAEAIATLDRLAGEFDGPSLIFGNSLYHEIHSRSAAAAEHARLKIQESERKQLVDENLQLKKNLVETELQIRPLRRHSQALERQVTALRGRLSSAEMQLARQRKAAKSLQATLAAVYKSSSWRITAPLRRLKSVLKR